MIPLLLSAALAAPLNSPNGEITLPWNDFRALYEKGLAPYPGIVAKTIFVRVDELFFVLPCEAQVARVDEAASEHFANRIRFASPRAMPPLPVLGIPGWHPDTARESWYDDERHFQGFAPGS